MEARITGITAPSVYNNNTRHVPFLPWVPLFPCHSHNSASSSFGISVLKKRKQKCILNVRAQSSTETPPPPPGDSNSRAVLDAFFIGKAFAEALNERIGMAIGEFLSEIGKLQAEQLKQTRDFQEEVLERAKIAKEKAAREAMAKEPEKDMSTSSFISSTSTATATDSSAASDNSSPSTDPSSTPNNSGPLSLDSN